MNMAPNFDIATRALVVTLKSPLVNMSVPEIANKTGLRPNTIYRIYSRAVKRGFDPDATPFVLKDEWLVDAPRSGRPPKAPEAESLIIEKVFLPLSLKTNVYAKQV